MEHFAVGPTIGEGQFGSVKEATVRATGAHIALKFVRMNRLSEGIPHPVAREALISTRLQCPFLVRTYDVFPHGSFLIFVMERCTTDLASEIRTRLVHNPLPAETARAYMRMLLTALAYLHQLGILHRDVKPSNCLIVLDNKQGFSPPTLKLGDYGLSRVLVEDADMSHEVASRWYRAPELLLGKRRYGSEVDMWSAGCVFGELLRGFGAPLFTGDGDISQLAKIFAVLGTPAAPGEGENRSPLLPDDGRVSFEPVKGVGLRALVPAASKEAVDLLSRLLTLDPSKRMTAAEALRHPYFRG